MTELSINEHIVFNSVLTRSQLLALLSAGALKRSEIGAMFRDAMDHIPSGPARSHLLAYTEEMEAAESDAEARRLLLVGWLPEGFADAQNLNALN